MRSMKSVMLESEADPWLDTNISGLNGDRKRGSHRIILLNPWSLIIWKFRLQRNNVLSFLQRIKQMQKPDIRRNLGKRCVLTVPCGSVGCPALFMYFVPGFVPLLYHAVFHAAFQVRSNIFLHQSDQGVRAFLRCPGDVRRDVQAVVVRHFFSNGLSLADRLAGKYIERCSGDQALSQGHSRVSRSFTTSRADVDQN